MVSGHGSCAVCYISSHEDLSCYVCIAYLPDAGLALLQAETMAAIQVASMDSV